MRQMQLGQSGIAVSEWSLGTMTYGNQTPPADAHRQLDLSLDAGITLIDCAEMYPVNPVRAETVGLSETILGDWLARPGNRARAVVATKVAGPARWCVMGRDTMARSSRRPSRHPCGGCRRM